MDDPSDLEHVGPRVEDAAGRLRVPGLGHVVTGFVSLGRLPLVPIQSALVPSSGRGEIMLPRLVYRSVLLAILRRWGGVLVIPGALLLGIEGHRLPTDLALLCSVPIVAFIASWWPLGRAGHRLATAIARSAERPVHEVELAFGRIDERQHADAEQRWEARQAELAAKKRETYEAGLRARREARQRRRDRARR